MLAFARGNALRMNVLRMRYEDVGSRFSDLADTVEKMKVASDDRIRELELEVRDMVGNLTAKDRLKRDLVLHNSRLRKQHNIVKKAEQTKAAAKAMLPQLGTDQRKWGAELGETEYFQGAVGSQVPEMEPKKGGKLIKHREYAGWSESSDFKVVADNKGG